jgi:uncharacterized protein Yka (UPF0111/DUF47 family)
LRHARLARAAAGTLQIVEEVRPKETSTDRIEAALNALLIEQKKDPITH